MDAKKLSEREVYGDLVRSQDYEELRTALRESEEREKKLVEALREIVKQYRNVRNAEGYPDPLPNSSLPTADALLALYPPPAKEESNEHK